MAGSLAIGRMSVVLMLMHFLSLSDQMNRTRCCPQLVNASQMAARV